MNESAAAIIGELSNLLLIKDAPANHLELAGRLLIRAIDEGAWSGPEHIPFVTWVRQHVEQTQPNTDFISVWRQALWFLREKPTAPHELEASFSDDGKLVIEALKGVLLASVSEQDEYFEPDEEPVTPESRVERAQQLRRATAKAWACLDKATTASKLEAFWLARRADLDQHAIQVEFPTFIERTWKILRKLADKAGVNTPDEPSVGRHSTFVEAYQSRETIPVDQVLLRNTVEKIIGLCRQMKALQPDKLPPRTDSQQQASDTIRKERLKTAEPASSSVKAEPAGKTAELASDAAKAEPADKTAEPVSDVAKAEPVSDVTKTEPAPNVIEARSAQREVAVNEPEHRGGTPHIIPPVKVEHRSNHPWGDDDPETPLSPAKLADHLGIPADNKKPREALRKRLESWRKAHVVDSGWIEDKDPKHKAKILLPDWQGVGPHQGSKTLRLNPAILRQRFSLPIKCPFSESSGTISLRLISV